MAEQCRGIDTALKNLTNSVNQQNKRIANLEKQLNQCCGSGNNNQNNSSLEARVKALEKNQEAFKIGIVETLKNFADIENTNREFMQAFQALHDMVIPLVEFIGSIFDLFGGKRIK